MKRTYNEVTSVPSQSDLGDSGQFNDRGWGRVRRWGAGGFCWVPSAVLSLENLGKGMRDEQCPEGPGEDEWKEIQSVCWL